MMGIALVSVQDIGKFPCAPTGTSKKKLPFADILGKVNFADVLADFQTWPVTLT